MRNYPAFYLEELQQTTKKVNHNDAKSRYEWKDLTNMKHKSYSSVVPVCTKTQQCYVPAIYHNDIQQLWGSPLSQKPEIHATSALAARV